MLSKSMQETLDKMKVECQPVSETENEVAMHQLVSLFMIQCCIKDEFTALKAVELLIEKAGYVKKDESLERKG